MKYLIAYLLGLVQGLSEFLPISSSGHLMLITTLTKNAVSEEMFGSFFTVMLHVATLAAVVVVYRKQIKELIRWPLHKTVILLIIATLPTVVFALILSAFDALDDWLDAGNLLGLSFLVTSVLLFASDLLLQKKDRRRGIDEMTWKDALTIGGMQAVGVLPGVSRSGSTISGALFAGLDRRAAADFSFLLSIPAILGGMALEFLKLIKAPESLKLLGTFDFWLCLLPAMAIAAVTGYFAVRFMLQLIKKKSLRGFAIYTGVLGVFVLLCQLFGWFGFGFTKFGG